MKFKEIYSRDIDKIRDFVKRKDITIKHITGTRMGGAGYTFIFYELSQSQEITNNSTEQRNDRKISSGETIRPLSGIEHIPARLSSKHKNTREEEDEKV